MQCDVCVVCKKNKKICVRWKGKSKESETERMKEREGCVEG
jgi:hypothetical protein